MAQRKACFRPVVQNNFCFTDKFSETIVGCPMGSLSGNSRNPAIISGANWTQNPVIASAADLTFQHHLRQARLGTSNRKAAL
jgi:hypothetical protein